MTASSSKALLLHNTLVNLFDRIKRRNVRDSPMDDNGLVMHMKTLLANYSSDDQQEAVLIHDQDNQIGTLLHQAVVLIFEFDLPIGVIHLLLDADSEKKSIFEANEGGDLPIHVACIFGNIQAVPLLLDADLDKKSIFESNEGGDLPIHFACESGNIQAVRLLLDADPEKKSILETDTAGNLPIHWACIRGNVQAVRLLLDADSEKKSILETDTAGNLPIHWACIRGNVQAVRLLLDADSEKKSIFEANEDGFLPIHFPCESGNIQATKCLLQAMISLRIKRLGLAQWKFNVSDCINDMTDDDDRTERIQKIGKAYNCLWKHEMTERTSLLELAAWKISCCFKTPSNDYDNFDPAEHKKIARINGKMGPIINYVLHFLPRHNDTVENLPKIFSSTENQY